MKHKRHKGSDDEESSEDERTFNIPEEDNFVEEQEEEEEELFEYSQQDLTQVVPRSTQHEETLPLDSSKKKKKKKKKSNRVDTDEEVGEEEVYNGHSSSSNYHNQRNGYRVREVNPSEIPEHLLKNLKRLQPKESDATDGLTSEDVEAACSGDDSGIWILKCPKEVTLSSILAGKKLSLSGNKSLLGREDDEDMELTQYLPSDSLGVNVRNRQYESVSVSNDEFKEGVVLLLPENNSYKIVAAPVQGHIIVRESVQELQVPKLEIPEPKIRELPSGIKERHPVYGADFTSIINEMEGSPTKKKKKKKSQEYEDEEPEVKLKPPKFTNLSINTFSGKNYKTDEELESEDSFKKKKKKHKRNKDDISYEEPTECIIAEPELIKIKQEETPSKSKKKSKKRKRDEMEELEDSKEHLFLANGDGDPPPMKKSKKSKHRDHD